VSELGVEAQAEQQAVGVGPVVEMAAVVVGLQHPHVRVASGGVDAVSVSRGLRVEHHLVQFGDAERATLASREHVGLEAKATGDVDHDLAGADQIHVEQAESFVAVRTGKTGLGHQGLTEDACRLGKRHGQPLLQWRATGQLHVVVCVTEFVGGGLRRFGAATPVEEHERSVADEGHAEGATDLAVPRFGVKPRFVNGAVDESCERGGVGGERPAHEADPRLPVHLVRRDVERREQVPPRETVPVAVQAALRAHPAPKHGKRVLHRGVHGLEGQPTDAVGIQRRVKRRFPVASAVHRIGLALDAVHRRRARHGDSRPGAHLGVVGRATYRRVGMSRQPADSGHWHGLRPVGEIDGLRELRGQVGLQAPPCGRSCGAQFGVEVFLGLRHLVRGAGLEARERSEVVARNIAHRR